MFLSPMILRVTADHQRSYETPIVAQAGDRVKLGRRDADAPGWVWCGHLETGRAGWTPDAYLEPTDDPSIATLTRSYDAIELTIADGQQVRPSDTIAGWTWCVSVDGRGGWVPDAKLQAEGGT